MNTQILHLLGTGLSLGGVAVTNKVLAAGWKKVTGHEPPAKNPDPDEAWTGIIIWALMTGLVGTVIKVGISRQVAKFESKDSDPSRSSQSEI